MSSVLYSRYIPPKYIKPTLQHENGSTLEASEATPSSTRNTPHEPPSFRPDSPQQTSTQTMPSSPSKLLKRKRKNDDHLLDDQLQRPKRSKGHKFLLLKRDKSAKKAEKLAETTPTELEEMTALETRTALGETTALEDRIALDEVTDFHPLEPLPQPKRTSTDPFKTTDHTLPEWLRSPIRVSATTTAQFTELGIPIAASKILESRGFPHAFAVQVGLLQLLAVGNREQRGDVLVSAPTGSGKTLGYVLPMMSEISKMSAPRLRAIIVVPTRELAYQVGAVCNMAASIFSGKGRRKVQYEVASGNRAYKNEVFDMMDAKIVYNPVEYESRRLRQANNWDPLGYETKNGSQPCCKNLSISSCPGHIVNHTFKGDMLICTPGRLIQHLLQTDGFDLSFVNWLVIDEADRLFAQSYQDFLKLVMANLARGGERQVTKVILSATLKKEVGQLTALKLKKPKLVVLEGADYALTTTARDADVKPNAVCLLPDKLIEVGIRVKSVHEKVLQLLTMLRDIGDGHPRLGKGSVLVFTKTNEATARLARLISLLEPTTTVGTVTSMIPVSTRRKIIQNFDSENFSVLVASDIASRGLDLPGLRYVINYDMPANLETYVHRVGRTARAGKEGIAFTLFTTQFEGSRWKEISRNISLNQADGMRCVETESAVPTYEKDFMERYEAALKTLAKEACRA